MILIQSSSLDYCTNMVIDWFSHQKKEFRRINDNVIIESFYSSHDHLSVNLMEYGEINITEITSYWYRRGSIETKMSPLNKVAIRALKETFETHQLEENRAMEDVLLNSLNSKKKIGDLRSCNNVNKILILNLATNLGLKTPDYIITNKKKDVLDFKKKVKRIICKSIAGNFIYKTDKYWYPNYTTELTDRLLKKIPQNFSFSLIQKLIEKKLEIRSFYLLGKFYSMAIFSQNDQQTKTDFRHYNYSKPNRSTPFNLPKSVEKKLDDLMKALSFESGSIDLIYTTSNEYVFLEVNPVGQFGMVSHPCNYYLEKKIAEYLI